MNTFKKLLLIFVVGALISHDLSAAGGGRKRPRSDEPSSAAPKGLATPKRSATPRSSAGVGSGGGAGVGAPIPTPGIGALLAAAGLALPMPAVPAAAPVPVQASSSSNSSSSSSTSSSSSNSNKRARHRGVAGIDQGGGGASSSPAAASVAPAPAKPIYAEAGVLQAQLQAQLQRAYPGAPAAVVRYHVHNAICSALKKAQARATGAGATTHQAPMQQLILLSDVYSHFHHQSTPAQSSSSSSSSSSSAVASAQAATSVSAASLSRSSRVISKPCTISLLTELKYVMNSFRGTADYLYEGNPTRLLLSVSDSRGSECKTGLLSARASLSQGFDLLESRLLPQFEFHKLELPREYAAITQAVDILYQARNSTMNLDLPVRELVVDKAYAIFLQAGKDYADIIARYEAKLPALEGKYPTETATPVAPTDDEKKLKAVCASLVTALHAGDAKEFKLRSDSVAIPQQIVTLVSSELFKAISPSNLPLLINIIEAIKSDPHLLRSVLTAFNPLSLISKERGQTLLWSVSCSKEMDIFTLLIKTAQEHDIAHQDNLVITMLTHADERCKMNCLMWCSSDRSLDKFRFILETASQYPGLVRSLLTAVDNSGSSVLMMAAGRGGTGNPIGIEIVKCIIDKAKKYDRANPDSHLLEDVLRAVDHRGQTALALARSFRYHVVVLSLTEAETFLRSQVAVAAPATAVASTAAASATAVASVSVPAPAVVPMPLTSQGSATTSAAPVGHTSATPQDESKEARSIA